MSLRRNSAWMFTARVLRVLVAAAYFTLLARSLGVSGYGAFAGACALAGMVAPFATLGMGNILIQEVSRDRHAFAGHWGNCLLITVLSGAALAVLVLIVARFILPRSLPLVFVLNIAIADLLLVRLLDVSAMAFQALEQLRMTAWFSLALTMSRLGGAAVLFLVSRHATPLRWSSIYLGSTAIPCCLAVCSVSRHVGFPVLRVSTNLKEVVHGMFFSISLSAQTVYNDIDKTMLARISGLGAAGLYGAAYRVVDAAFTPVGAVQAAAYARFFQRGSHGLREATRLAARILSHVVLYSVAAGILLWVAAPMIPPLLGNGFGETTTAVRILSPLLLLRSLHCFAADSLTGAGYQGSRTLLQVGIALLNVGLNFMILSHYSWRGAAWTSLICEASLAAALWATVAIYCAREHGSASASLSSRVVEA